MRNFAKVHVYRRGKNTEDRGKRKREFLKGYQPDTDKEQGKRVWL